MSGKIFISHAVQDKTLVDGLLDLMMTGLNITRPEIYCSSDDEIPTGVNWVKHIQDNINNAKIVLFLITPNFMQSHFCISEMGAAWANNQNIYPMVMAPLTYKVLDTTPLRGITQVKTISSIEDLVRLSDEFVDLGLAKGVRAANFRGKANTFWTKVEEWKQELVPQQTVDLEQHKKLQKDYTEAIEDITKLQVLIEQQESKIKRLEGMKDREQVLEFKHESSTEWEEFMSLVEDVKDSLGDLDSIVLEVLYFEKFLKRLYNPTDWKDIFKFEAKQILRINGHTDEVEVDETHPLIRKALNSLYLLREFIEGGSVELFEIFENDTGLNLNLKNVDVWEKLFGVKIYI